VDGNLVTSRGPGTSTEFALKLAEMLTDIQTAIKIGHSMLVQIH
jgi:putative intracellular protease/amidase